MAYDLDCPHCGYGHNADEFENVEGEIGEHIVICKMCKKEFVVEVQTIFNYWGRKK
jgi:transcription elongation factor Elf1